MEEGGDVPEVTTIEGKYHEENDGTLKAARLQKFLDNAKANSKAEEMPMEQFTEQSTSEGNLIQNAKASLEEAARLDYLLRMQKTLNETFENAAWLHPHGLTVHDPCVVPECHHKSLEHFKMTLRRQNYKYLHQHPELDALMAVFMKRLLKVQPKDSVKFATEFFTFRRMATDDIQRLINDELVKLNKYRTPKGWKHNRDFIQEDLVNNVDIKGVNDVKILNLGPTAESFGVTPPPTPPKPRRSVKKIVKKPKPKVQGYCGCKDKGRRAPALKTTEPPTSDATKMEQCYGFPNAHVEY